MKKSIQFFGIFLLSPFFLFAQPVIMEDITLTSQSEIDSFPLNYPNISEIQGTLRIQGDSITNLDSLYTIESVIGSLQIYSCGMLENLLGLKNIAQIDELYLSSCGSLKQLNGLENITTIETLSIRFLSQLENLNGLENLSKVLYELRIQFNDNLIDISALSNIYILNNMKVEYNPRIKSLDPLENVLYSEMGISIIQNDSLESIVLNEIVNTEYLYILRNPLLETISCPKLKEIENVFSITQNNSLQSVGDFSELEFANYFYIHENEKLKSLDGFIKLGNVNTFSVEENIELLSINGFNGDGEITEIFIINNESLENIDAFNSCSEVRTDIEINNNTSLTEINGFSSVESIGGDLILLNNEELITLNAFDELTELKGSFIFQSNNSFQNLNSFNSLTSLGNSLIVVNNFSLQEFSGFNNLTHINGNFFFDNHIVEDLSGLNKLEEIEDSFTIQTARNLKSFSGLKSLDVCGALIIKYSKELENFAGLESLTRVGSFIVETNSALESFEGLNNLESIGGPFSILRNVNLKSLNGLENLRSTGSTYIHFNNKLENFNGLESLRKISTSLIISNQETLVSIDGLNNAKLPLVIEIYGNDMLSLCGTECICNHLKENPNGDYTILNNAPGCDSVEEIIEFCELSGVYDPKAFPDIEYEPEWNVLEIRSEFPTAAQTYTYQFLSDTVLCGEKYSVCNQEDLDRQIFTRSTNKKAYFRYNDDCNTKEYLLYDFNMQIEDTCWLGWSNAFEETDTLGFKLFAIDTIDYMGVERKRFHLTPLSQLPLLEQPFYWIEGIGSEFHPFYPLIDLGEVPNQNFLLCYDSAQNQLYQNNYWNTCDTSYTSINESLSKEFTISPNPFDKYIQITSSNQMINYICLTSVSGKIILKKAIDSKQAFFEIDHHLSSGIYIIQIYTDQGIIQRKLVKN